MHKTGIDITKAENEGAINMVHYITKVKSETAKYSPCAKFKVGICLFRCPFLEGDTSVLGPLLHT